MKNTIYIFIFIFFSLSIAGQSKSEEKQRDSAFYKVADIWFSAWKLVSKDIYKIDHVKPVDFVFFDDQYVYSTSDVTIKKGSVVDGPNLMNLQLKWKKALHNDSLTLPNEYVVPVEFKTLLSPLYDKPAKSFLMTPLPSFYENKMIYSDENKLNQITTASFLHNLSHSQQMQNFEKELIEYEEYYEDSYDPGLSFCYNVIEQNAFRHDSIYLKDYNKEINFFYSSIKNNSLDRKMIKNGLDMMKQRQNKYFVGEYKGWEKVEDLIVTMEGFADYSTYLWLIHPKGGNMKKKNFTELMATERLFEFAEWPFQVTNPLFLILAKLNKPKNWAKVMVGNKVKTVTELIDESVK